MEKIIYTLAVAAIGGYIGIKIKMPAGALIGAMIAVAVFNIQTGKGDVPSQFRVIAQVAVGAMIGLNFTMDTVTGLKNLVVPALVLVIGLTAFSLFLGFILSKVTGLDLVTALFSSAPGGLTDMTLISDAYGADTPKVALLHLVRLLTVISVLPLVIGWFTRLLVK